MATRPMLSRIATRESFITGVPGRAAVTGIPGRVLLTAGIVCAVAYLAPYPSARPALATLAAILCFIFLFPPIAGIPSHVWGPLLGTGALLFMAHAPAGMLGLVAPRLGWDVVASELSGHVAVPILILAFAYLSISLDDSGFFNWCSLKLMRAGRGSGQRLLVSIFLGVSLLTFFTSNDIVVLSITPILIYLGGHARIRNLVPFLIVQFVAANTASMGMYIGNPTNMVIGNAVGLGIVSYGIRMFLPTVVATAATLGLLLLLFSRVSRTNRIPERYDVLPRAEGEGWTRLMTIKVAVFAACLSLLTLVGNPWLVERLLHIHEPAALRSAVSWLILAISAVFALFALGLDVVLDRRNGVPLRAPLVGRMRRLPLEIVPFFLSFCVVLRGLEEAGLTRYAVDCVVHAFERGPVIGSLASGAYSVLAVNLMNNIPATILFEKAWLGNPAATPPIAGLADRLREMDPSYGDVFINSCLFGTNFGSNLTFIGALAGLMWLRLIRDHGRRAVGVERLPSARDFLVYGAILVPAVTAITCLAIGVSSLIGK